MSIMVAGQIPTNGNVLDNEVLHKIQDSRVLTALRDLNNHEPKSRGERYLSKSALYRGHGVPCSGVKIHRKCGSQKNGSQVRGKRLYDSSDHDSKEYLTL